MLNERQGSIARDMLIGALCAALGLLPGAFAGMAEYHQHGTISGTTALVQIVVFWSCVSFATCSAVLLLLNSRKKAALADQIRARTLKVVE